MDYVALKQQLIKHEGLKLKPYRCSANKLTVGVGRNIEDNGISEAEALFMLDNDIQSCVDICTKLFPDFENLSENRQHALIDLAFNVGEIRLKKFYKAVDAVNKKDFERAAVEFEDSIWYFQVGSRAKTICTMILDEGV